MIAKESIMYTHRLFVALFFPLLFFCAASASANSESEALRPYTDKEHTVSIGFPPDFTVTTDPASTKGGSYLPVDSSNMILAGFYSGTAYSGTNFSHACVVVAKQHAQGMKTDCAEYDGDPLCSGQNGVTQTMINNVAFYHASFKDAAMGHRQKSSLYWTTQGQYRYKIILTLSYTDMGMYSPGTVNAFDKKGCLQTLQSILHSFTFFQEAPPAPTS